MRQIARVPLLRDSAGLAERVVIEAGTLSAALFRYASGIEALRFRNGRGEVIVLPWFGQMIWSAVMDGVALGMRSGFAMPLPAATIIGTYGCLAYHSGLLRNGVPGAGDDHAVHGEFPCAEMRAAWLELLEAEDGRLALRLVSERDHVVGFGPHYLAHPAVTLGEGDGTVEMALAVQNRSGHPMELMYMCHVNFASAPGGRIVQAAPFTPEHVVVRRAVPAHARPTPAYLAFIEALAEQPSRMERLDEPALYDPEQVFYLRGLGTDADGRTALLLRRDEGDAFSVGYAPAQFPHCVRWILEEPDLGVAAFALPSTCEPEGYTAEKRKGNVRLLAPGARAEFAVQLGHLDVAEAAAAAARIAAMQTRQGETA